MEQERLMTKKGLSVIVACGILLALAGHTWAQGQPDTGLEGLPPDLLRDVAGIHQTLNRLVDLLEGIEGNQRMDLLIKRLDGLTGYEIVARVGWRKPAPGKGPAEKGAADAKIIDS